MLLTARLVMAFGVVVNLAIAGFNLRAGAWTAAGISAAVAGILAGYAVVADAWRRALEERAALASASRRTQEQHLATGARMVAAMEAIQAAARVGDDVDDTRPH